jgi:hypothetical protein
MLGAVPIDHREPAVYAFNRTYDIHTNGSRIALLISEKSRNLFIYLKKIFRGRMDICITFKKYSSRS